MRYLVALAPAVAVLCTTWQGWAQVPPPPQKQVMTFPLAVAPGQPPPSVQCSVAIGPTVPVAALAFRPDGKMLASAGYQEVLLWDLAGARLARRIGTGQLAETVGALAFHKDGKLLAVGDGSPHRSGGVKVFDTDSGQIVAACADPKEVVYGVASSPDGNLLAAGSADNQVHVWNLAEKKLLQVLKEHGGWVMHVAFSTDGTVRVHDAGGGHIATLPGHTGWVHAVALNADASRLASGDAGGSVRLWNTADNTLLATLVQLSPRSDEWLIATAGYLATSSPAALQWTTANVKTPADKLPGILHNAEMVQKVLAGTKPPPAAVP